MALHPRVLFHCVLVTILLLSADAIALTMGEAIDIASRQRMLSQRIAQSYLLTGIHPDSSLGHKQLARSIKEFDENLEILQAFAAAKPLQRDLQSLEQIWQQYKFHAQLKATKANADQLLYQSKQVLSIAHAYVEKLEKLSSQKQARLINIAGRQAMLSQRIAKNFFARSWGIGDKAATAAITEDIAEYAKQLGFLQNNDFDNAAIKARLKKVDSRFKKARESLDDATHLEGIRMAIVVSGTTGAMLQGMEKVTRLYAQLPD